MRHCSTCSRARATIACALASALLATPNAAPAYVIPVPVGDEISLAETIEAINRVTEAVEEVGNLVEYVEGLTAILDGGAIGMLSMLPLPITDAQRAIGLKLLQGEIPIEALTSGLIDPATLGPLQKKMMEAAVRVVETGSVDGVREIVLSGALSAIDTTGLSDIQKRALDVAIDAAKTGSFDGLKEAAIAEALGATGDMDLTPLQRRALDVAVNAAHTGRIEGVRELAIAEALNTVDTSGLDATQQRMVEAAKEAVTSGSMDNAKLTIINEGLNAIGTDGLDEREKKLVNAAKNAVTTGSMEEAKKVALSEALAVAMTSATGIAEEVGLDEEPWQRQILDDVGTLTGEWRDTNEAPSWQRVLALQSVRDPIRTAMGTAGHRVHPSIANELEGSAEAILEGHPPLSVLTNASKNAAITYASESETVQALVEKAKAVPKSLAETILREDRDGRERTPDDPESWTTAIGSDDGRVETDADGTINIDQASQEAWKRAGGEMMDDALANADKIASLMKLLPERSKAGHVQRILAKLPKTTAELQERAPLIIAGTIRDRTLVVAGQTIEGGLQNAVDAAIAALPPGTLARARETCRNIGEAVPDACNWTEDAKAAFRSANVSATNMIADALENDLDNLHLMHAQREQRRHGAIATTRLHEKRAEQDDDEGDTPYGTDGPMADDYRDCTALHPDEGDAAMSRCMRNKQTRRIATTRNKNAAPAARTLNEVETRAAEMLIENVAHAELGCTPPDSSIQTFEMSDDDREAMDLPQPISTAGVATSADFYYSASAVETEGPPAVRELKEARMRQTRDAAINLWATAAIAPERATDHHEKLKAMTKRMEACESLTCDVRIYADTLRIEAQAAAAQAELALAELRYTTARAIQSHRLTRQ